MHALVTATLKSDTGVAKDQVVNTFHFQTGANTVDAVAPALLDAVGDFYTEVPGAGRLPVETWLSSHVSNLADALTLKAYDLGDLVPRVPKLTAVRPVVAGAGAMPSEVAVCLSYRGALIGGVPAARRRGRIYIGPLTTAANDNGRPADALKADLNQCAATLFAQAIVGGATWCVYSKLNNMLTNIAEFWVDNAFDTVRKRGVAITEKVFKAAV